MSTGTITVLVILLVIIAVVAALASIVTSRRARRLRRIGPEFGRLARQTGPRRARAEFASRQRRVDGMGIKPLPGERRSGYVRQWMAAQERFIDNPSQAAAAAAGLVTAVASERGYDVSDPGRLLVDLSVYHGRYLDGYRRAREVTGRTGAATEELRQALLGHRALFRDLLAEPSSRSADRPGRRGRGDGRRGAWRQVVTSLRRLQRGRTRQRGGGRVVATRS